MSIELLDYEIFLVNYAQLCLLLSIANYEKILAYFDWRRDVLTTGNQLRAARALVNMDQGTLASRAGVNINTISSMEKKGSDTLTSGLDKIRSVMVVLEEAGVEFLNHGQPGVRLKNVRPDDPNRT